MTEEQDGLYEIPKSWSWTKLHAISDMITDGSHAPPPKQESGIPMLSAQNIFNDKILFSDVRYISQNAFDKEYQRAPVKQNDVLLTIVGTIGRSTVVKPNTPIFTLQRSVALVKTKINPNYLSLFFQSPMLFSCMKKKARGTAQKGIYLNQLKEIPVAVAPLNEQRRIVGKIEELFSFLDAGVESLRKVQAQLKRYRQAVLKYAFEGKLTEEWRKTHKDQIKPATKLLEQVKQERKKDPKYKELPPIDVFNPLELPENWTWTRLGEIIFLSNERCNPTISENQRFVGLEHIESNTGKLLGFGKSSETRSTKNWFKQGDLLYGKLRPYLNKVWVANFNGVCSTDILVFQKNNFISNEYLAACLLNQSFVEYTNQHMSGVQHPRVSYQILSQYIVPLPPLLEQLKIAEEVQRSFSVADEVERATEQNLKKAEFLRQSILKVAFEGKLVPQDPIDEPAEKLLERIREERAKSKGEKDINKKKNKPRQLELSSYVK